MPGADSTRGGYDTARVGVPASDRDRERTQRQRAKARANLEAFALERFPGDLAAAAEWFGEYASMLGLIAPPDRVSGMCAVCGKEIAIWRNVRLEGRRPDTCSRGCAGTLNLHPEKGRP